MYSVSMRLRPLICWRTPFQIRCAVPRPSIPGSASLTPGCSARSLIAQNQTWEAQRVLTTAASKSLEDVSGAVAKTTKFWTALGNSISNAWDATGEFIARQLSLQNSGAAEKIDEATKALDRLRVMRERIVAKGGDTAGIDRNIAGEIQKRDEASASMQRYTTQTASAQAAQRSFLQESTVRSLLPEIAQREQLNNQFKVLQDLMKSLGADEAAGQRLSQMSSSFDIIAKAIGVATAQISDFRTQFETTMKGMQLANQAITAFSPTERAEIAKQNSLLNTSNSGMDDGQRKALAEQAYTNSIKESRSALEQQARVRKLAAEQAVDSARLTLVKPNSSIPAKRPSQKEERRAA